MNGAYDYAHRFKELTEPLLDHGITSYAWDGQGNRASLKWIVDKTKARRIYNGLLVATWDTPFLLALSFIRSRIAKGTIINADESGSWDALHYEMKRINHEEAYSMDGLCTNWAEEFFSRVRGGAIVGHGAAA